MITRFLSYPGAGGAEIFEPQVIPWLKWFTGFIKVLVNPYLSHLCWHQHKGGKKMLMDVSAWLRPNDFVFKTDVHSYYASLHHNVLVSQVESMGATKPMLAVLIGYITRTVLRSNQSYQPAIGIPKGGSLSPLLGAIYLTPLDKIMERWVKRGDVY